MAKKPEGNRSGNPARRNDAQKHEAQQVESRREKLRRQREIAARREKNRRITMVVGGVVAVIAVIALVVVAIVNQTKKNTDLIDATPGVLGEGQVVPKHSTADQTGILDPRVTNSDAALQLQLYVDYQCPWCAIAENALDTQFTELMERGEISIVYRLKTMMDAISTNNPDSSTRAARAAACSDMVGKYVDYHRAIFANQPVEGEGFTDVQLREIYPEVANIVGDDLTSFLSCYDNGQTEQFVNRVDANAADITATPTILVNGKEWSWSSATLDGNAQVKDPAPSADEILESLKQAAEA